MDRALNVHRLGIRQRQMLGLMLLKGHWPYGLRGNDYNTMKSLEKRGLVYRDIHGDWMPTTALRQQAAESRPGNEPGQKGKDEYHN